MRFFRRAPQVARCAVACVLLLAAHPLLAQSRRVAQPMPTVERNLLETLASHREFATLLGYIRRAGLADTLATSGPFTVFAPTNAAFARVPSRVMSRWDRDRARLRRDLLRHVLVGSAFRHHIVPLGEAVMVSGDTIALRRMGNTVQLQERATVTAWSLRASNGAVHTIDRVLSSPPQRTGVMAARGLKTH